MQRALMRLSILSVCGFALLFSGVAVGQPPVPKKEQPKVDLSDAENLFLEMERKLLDAKSLRIEVEFGSIFGFQSHSILELTEGDRCRIESVTKILNEDRTKIRAIIRSTWVSDGSKSLWVAGTDEKGKEMKTPYDNPRLDVPKGYNQSIIMELTRGYFEPFLRLQTSKNKIAKFDEKIFSRLQSTALDKEKLDKKDVLKLEFHTLDAQIVGPPVKGTHTVWLDANTTLPIKRQRRGIEGVDTFRIDINPKLDPGRFVLPQEK